MTKESRRGRWFVSVLSLALGAVLALPASALAAVAATNSAAVGMSTATWAAVATSRNGSAGNSAYTYTYVRGSSGSARNALFDIVNTGSVPLSGVTLSLTNTQDRPSGNVTVTACVNGAWTGSGSSYTCSGQQRSLGSVSRDGGSISATLAIPSGARVSLRAQTTRSGSTTPSARVNVAVSRSRAPAGTAR